MGRVPQPDRIWASRRYNGTVTTAAVHWGNQGDVVLCSGATWPFTAWRHGEVTSPDKIIRGFRGLQDSRAAVRTDIRRRGEAAGVKRTA
jgi:hypothetical protein